MSNEAFGWLWIHLGVISGMLLGMGFLKPAFLGGYDSARRRLLRLGHISFIGLGGLNILFAYSSVADLGDAMNVASIALIVAAVSMPLVCGATAWRHSFFPLFVVPVSSAWLATALITWEMLK